jgi:hypothetical protein
LSYPVELSCPPVNAAAGEAPGTCSIGDLPRYTVNATRPEDIAAAILFAKEHNIRLVIKDTGHDILGRYGEFSIWVSFTACLTRSRSTGYGSLQAWTRYIRTGIIFQRKYRSSHRCKKSTWNGSAFTIGGGYTWSDVYPIAASQNLVVVGGGTPV